MAIVDDGWMEKSSCAIVRLMCTVYTLAAFRHAVTFDIIPFVTITA